MPIIKSAIKRNRQNATRRARNLRTQRTYQKAIKDAVKTAEAGDATAASATISVAYKAIDMAAKKRVISQEKAGRKKSQLARVMKESGVKMPKGKAKTTIKPAPKKTAAKKEAPKKATRKKAAPKKAVSKKK